MSTSGSIDFDMTGQEIVQAAVSIISEKSSEVGLEPGEVSDGLKALNRLVKSWQGQPVHLWKRDEAIVFLTVGTSDYQLGGTSPDKSCLADDFIQTTTTADLAAGVITIPVASTVGMQGLIDSGVADKIGIRLTDGTRQWTTIENVNSATELQITAPLTGASTSGYTVFTYTTDLERPLRIESVRRTKVGNNTEVELSDWSRQEYFAQTNKTSQGTPTAFYYSPRKDNGKFYIWQTASSTDQYAKVTVYRSIQDFDVSSNNPDFPAEWLDALVWNLAAKIGHEYQTPLSKMQLVKQEAMELLEAVMGWDEEDNSLNLQPDNHG